MRGVPTSPQYNGRVQGAPLMDMRSAPNQAYPYTNLQPGARPQTGQSNLLGLIVIGVLFVLLVAAIVVRRTQSVTVETTPMPGLALPPSVFRPQAQAPFQQVETPGLPPSTTVSPLQQCSQGPCRREFYMYRAQSDDNYAMQNVNAASLSGVMWYLHNEIVKSMPRKYNVTRVMRLKVTMMTTQKWWDAHQSQFGPYVAFDGAKCTVPNCDNIWDTYGFVPGCQQTQLEVANYQAEAQSLKYCQGYQCRSPVWYSLPGPCPSADFLSKTDECNQRWPGGFCFANYNETTGVGSKDDWAVTGAWNCTFHVEWAGQVRLDELVGIENYEEFFYAGLKEYDETYDRGFGVSFWDGIHNETACNERMMRLKMLLAENVQASLLAKFPFDLPEPICDST